MGLFGWIQMETDQVSGVRIGWVLADDAMIDPTIDMESLKAMGPMWGSWKTWRSYQTDNVICNDKSKAVELVKRQFQQRANLYLPESAYLALDRPPGVKIYSGQFAQDMERADEIIALHLASSMSDVIILLGFDLEDRKIEDRLVQHRRLAWKSQIKFVIKENPSVQWVLLDQCDNVYTDITELPNLVLDSLDNVLG